MRCGARSSSASACSSGTATSTPRSACPTAPSNPRRAGQLRPLDRPDRRAPHAWLADGSSLLDHYGKGFALVATAPAARPTSTDRGRGRRLAGAADALRVGDAAIARLYERPFVLSAGRARRLAGRPCPGRSRAHADTACADPAQTGAPPRTSGSRRLPGRSPGFVAPRYQHDAAMRRPERRSVHGPTWAPRLSVSASRVSAGTAARSAAASRSGMSASAAAMERDHASCTLCRCSSASGRPAAGYVADHSDPKHGRSVRAQRVRAPPCSHCSSATAAPAPPPSPTHPDWPQRTVGRRARRRAAVRAPPEAHRFDATPATPCAPPRQRTDSASTLLTLLRIVPPLDIAS